MGKERAREHGDDDDGGRKCEESDLKEKYAHREEPQTCLEGCNGQEKTQSQSCLLCSVLAYCCFACLRSSKNKENAKDDKHCPGGLQYDAKDQCIHLLQEKGRLTLQTFLEAKLTKEEVKHFIREHKMNRRACSNGRGVLLTGKKRELIAGIAKELEKCEHDWPCSVTIVGQDEVLRKVFVRRKLSQAERKHILQKTDGYCYLCGRHIVAGFPWDADHVLAFVHNPERNDVAGNMLPAHPSCNRSKGCRSLTWCAKNLSISTKVIENIGSNVATFVRDELHEALELKHRLKKISDKVTEQALIDGKEDEGLIHAICDELQGLVKREIHMSEQVRFIQDGEVKGTPVEIAKGGACKVYKSKVIIDGEEIICALKDVRQNHEKLKQEAYMLEMCQHEHVVKCYGIITLKGDIPQQVLVLEYIDFTLAEEGSNKGPSGQEIFWKEAVKSASALARAIRHVHHMQVLHRDIKPANVLVSKRGDVKLADFGESLFLSDDSEIAHIVGTKGYIAPEVGKPGGRHSSASDVYSFGKTLETSGLKSLIDVREDALFFKALTADCTVDNPDARLTMDTVVARLEQYEADQNRTLQSQPLRGI